MPVICERCEVIYQRPNLEDQPEVAQTIQSIEEELETALVRYEQAEDLENALKAYWGLEARLLALALNPGDLQFQAQQRILAAVLMRQANILRQFGRREKAAEVSICELEAARQSSDDLTLARSLVSYGATLIFSGDVEPGLEYLEEGRRRARPPGAGNRRNAPEAQLKLASPWVFTYNGVYRIQLLARVGLRGSMGKKEKSKKEPEAEVKPVESKGAKGGGNDKAPSPPDQATLIQMHGVAREKKPKMKRQEYDQEIAKLHIELVKLQEWIKAKGLNMISHLLSQIHYEDLTPEAIVLPEKEKDAGYVRPPITDQTFVPEKY